MNASDAALADHSSFLRWVRTASRARTYLEIGVEKGSTLMMGGTTTRLAVGVDPDYHVVVPAEDPVRVALFRKTSDAFFADGDWHGVSTKPVDVTFVDGMHLCENALRDVLGAERLSHRRSLILVHDILPGSAAEAARERETPMWMGDVFRAVLALREFRPELSLTAIGDVAPSGMLVIADLDPRAAPVDLAAAQAFMEAIDFARDADRLLRPLLVARGSAESAALRRRVEGRFASWPAAWLRRPR